MGPPFLFVGAPHGADARTGGMGGQMPNENQDQQTVEDQSATQQQGQEQAEPSGAGGGTDWKAEARKWEARAKENKAKADKWDEKEEADKSELERMTERAQAAEREVANYRHAEEVRAWATEVSKETHVPASVLRGESKEEMLAHAKAILGAGLSAYGKVPDNGERGGSAVTRESILNIKNQRERVRAIAEHPELF